MPANIEVKCHCPSLPTLKDAVVRLTNQPEPNQTMSQVDTFFAGANGRLKLRVVDQAVSGELIQYHREDKADIKFSDYRTTPIKCAESLKEVLQRAYGIAGELRKTRYLWIREGQTRIHVDLVEGLGDFMELEVMLKPNQSHQEGERIAEEILRQIGASEYKRIDVAYIDLLLAKQANQADQDPKE